MPKKPNPKRKPAAKKRKPRKDPNQAAFDLVARLAGK